MRERKLRTCTLCVNAFSALQSHLSKESENPLTLCRRTFQLIRQSVRVNTYVDSVECALLQQPEAAVAADGALVTVAENTMSPVSSSAASARQELV